MTSLVINEADMTPDQRDVIVMLSQGPSVTRIEAWLELSDEPDLEPVLGVSFTDDGLTMTGFFSQSGQLLGDWLC